MPKYYRKRSTRAPRRRTFRRKKTYKKQNPLIRRKSGEYYKTQFTQVFELRTTNVTTTYAPMTLQLFGQIGQAADAAVYKDYNGVNPTGQQAAFGALFDQKRISGVRMKVVIPPTDGNLYSFVHLTTGQQEFVSLSPSRCQIAFDPNDQIGIEATQDQLSAKSGFQDVPIPPSRQIVRYFANSKSFKSIGLGTGWTDADSLDYNGQLLPGAGPSVHVRLITSMQGSQEAPPTGFRLGQLELTYYVTYRGKKTG